MEAPNGSALLPLLELLELIGQQISLLPMQVGETDMAMNVVLPQLALDLVSEEEASLAEGADE